MKFLFDLLPIFLFSSATNGQKGPKAVVAAWMTSTWVFWFLAAWWAPQKRLFCWPLWS